MTRWPPADPRSIRVLVRRLRDLRRRLISAEPQTPPSGFSNNSASARNFLHYLALRRTDLRDLQSQLADLGLSSLGRSESHVLYNLDAVLERLAGRASPRGPSSRRSAVLTPEEGRRRIARNAFDLFGPPRRGRTTRIMVTVPTEAARNPDFVRDLVLRGMDCMRINCAHDSPPDWLQMVRNLRAAVKATGIPCRVEIDLSGPRLRTGPVVAGPAVLRIRPSRSELGKTTAPARFALVSSTAPVPRPPAQGIELRVPAEWLVRRRVHERLAIEDARGSRRDLRVESRHRDRVVVSSRRSLYLTNGAHLSGERSRGPATTVELKGIAPLPGRIRLERGSRLLLSPRLAVGHGERRHRSGLEGYAAIGVSIPEVLGRIGPGERVWFDAGRIGGVALRRGVRGVLVQIDHVKPGGAWLRGGQGINLPDTRMGLASLTNEDLTHLDFAAQHGDLLGYSFVQNPRDIVAVRRQLARRGRDRMGIILKIETREAFDNLPALILSGLRHGPVGVMVARGDLAVEVGFDRLAEVQEEILWLCEAAHMPTVWATDVLGGLAKDGIPTRAEVTDAAMGERAECVMLNKGPYMSEAVRALDSILRRMQAHQTKKTAQLRHLRIAERFLAAVPEVGGARESIASGETRPLARAP